MDSDSVGPVSLRRCVAMMAAHRQRFAEELVRRGHAGCVDILVMCAVYDESLREPVRQVFADALRSPATARFRTLIENGMTELA